MVKMIEMKLKKRGIYMGLLAASGFRPQAGKLGLLVYLGTYVGRILKGYTRINKWSKWKVLAYHVEVHTDILFRTNPTIIHTLPGIVCNIKFIIFITN
jgi:hypothetical protein